MTSRGGWGRKQVTSSIDDKIMFILVFTFWRDSRANSFNPPARDPKGHVSVLNINRPSSDGIYGLYKLEITENLSWHP
jgi:hypothetical protein